MSDTIGGALKDLVKETVKQVATAPITIAKGVPGQIVNSNSEEEETRKKEEKAQTYQRVREIEAEMRQIASKNQQKTGPELSQTVKNESSELKTKNKELKIDEASRQAIGRAEQGRNFKG